MRITLMDRVETKPRVHSLYQGQFKEIDSEIKAYFIGFMYADGCISNIKNSHLSSKHITKVSIAEEDSNILYKIKEELPFFRVGSFDYSKYNHKCVIQKSLTYNSKYCYNDLKLHGLVERKSYENKNFLTVPKTINEKLLHHFIRGFFDGDGSISIATKRPNLRRVDMCSVSETLIKSIHEWFCKNDCAPDVFRTKTHLDVNRQKVFILEWFKSDKIIKFRELLYKDSTIYLQRKKDKFDSFKIISRITSPYICEKCGSHTTSNGKRKMVGGIAHRYKCANCNYGFTKYDLAPVKSGELLETPNLERQEGQSAAKLNLG